MVTSVAPAIAEAEREAEKAQGPARLEAADPNKATSLPAERADLPCTVAGSVRWYGSERPVAGAVVVAIPVQDNLGGARREWVTTRQDGGFCFREPGLKTGRWRFIALHEKASANSLPSSPSVGDNDAVKPAWRQIKDGQLDGQAQDPPQVGLYLRWQDGTINQEKGKRFVGVLIGALLLLVLLYIGLHASRVAEQPPADLGVMGALFVQAQLQFDELEKAAGSATLAGAAAPASTTANTSGTVSNTVTVQDLATTLTVLRSTWLTISPTVGTVNPNERAAVLGLIDSTLAAATPESLSGVGAGLKALGNVLQPPPGLIWNDDQRRYLEVLFWALAGVLVSVIFQCGWYLRKQTFYEEGIWMHLTQIAAVPILAVVGTLLLSFVTITLTLNQTEVHIQLADPRMLAAVAFLLGLGPWGLWDMLRNASRRVTDTDTRAGSSPVGA